MYSNFITPPDFVRTILIIDATEEQIAECAETCKNIDVPYNVYFYNKQMDDLDWLVQAVKRSDCVLQAEGSDVPVLERIQFGSNQIYKNPAEYLTK